jgi:hypothetical protein
MIEPAIQVEKRASNAARWICVTGVSLLLLLAAFVALAIPYVHKGRISPSGGRYFFERIELPVVLYRQGDDRWRNDLLGNTVGRLGAEGCAVASAAMVLQFYGLDTDPGRLNAFLTRHHRGYTPEGWIWWEDATDLMPGLIEKAYEGDPSYFLIDSNLAAGNPVISRLRFPSGVTHFVVIVGKDGFDYLVQDPGAGGSKGVYPLKEFGSDIEAIRYYRRLK